MKYFLIIWYTLINGQSYANVTDWETEAACEAKRAELSTDMTKGKENGRWGMMMEEFHAVCIPVEDATLET